MSKGWCHKQSKLEGWILFSAQDEVPEILGVYGGQFHKDEDFSLSLSSSRALQFVKEKAREGSAYRIEALARTQIL